MKVVDTDKGDNGSDDRVTSRQRRQVTLILASAPWHEVVSAAEILHQRGGWKGDVHYFLGPFQPVLTEYLRARGETVLYDSIVWWRLPLTALRLRRRRFERIVALFTGERWYRRIKVLAFLVGMNRLIVLNENGDFFHFSHFKLLRHARWRLRQWSRRWFHLARSALGLLEKEGLGSAWERFRRRHPVTGRRLSMLRVRLSGLKRSRIALNDNSEPEVSIVIPAYNQWGFTRRCLQSIQRYTRRPFEVILVDNDSTDATRHAESRVRGLRVVHMQENVGFVGACNAGAEIARGRYVLFLNNDIMVSAGWLDALVDAFEREPSCGAVGAKLIYPSGILQEAGGILWSDGTAWNYGKFDNPDLPQYCYRRSVDYCSGAALMVRNDELRAIGGFDQRFAPGYWEDADLCLTLRSRGKTIWFQPRCQLYHFEGASSGTDLSRGMKRYQSVNRQTFREKWESTLADQPDFDPRLLFLARDRNPNPVVLAFDHYVPTPDRDAGSAFFHRFLKSLMDQGYRVLLWPDNLFRSPEYTDELQNMGVEVLYGPLSYEAFVSANGRFIDFAIAYRALIAERYLPQLRELGVTLGYIAVDLEHVREGRRSNVEGASDCPAAALQEREREIVALVDTVGVHSTEEARIVRTELGGRRIVHLPLAVSVNAGFEVRPGFEARQGLVFVGSTHPPNVDGLRHFVAKVWDRVRDTLGDIPFRVVGDVCNSVPELADRPGIELMGFVEDLGSVLDRSRVFVAPLRYGAGVKGKILEAMNHGIPVVTTTVGVEGSGITPDVQVLVAEDDERFARRVVDLYTRLDLWSSTCRRGRDLIDRLYSPDGFDRQVRCFMKSMAEGSAPAPRLADSLPAKRMRG